jgi:hypothetical protein
MELKQFCLGPQGLLRATHRFFDFGRGAAPIAMVKSLGQRLSEQPTAGDM